MDEKEREVIKQAREFMSKHPCPLWVDGLLSLLEARDKEIAELKVEVEQLQVKLAGCGVAAIGGTKNPAGKDSYGWSVAYQDTLNLRMSYDRLKAEVERLKADSDNNKEMFDHYCVELSKVTADRDRYKGWMERLMGVCQRKNRDDDLTPAQCAWQIRREMEGKDAL